MAALVVLCVSLLIVTLDNTILNVALPTLVKELGATTTQLQWIVDADALAFAGLMLVSGSSADRFGRRRVFTGGLAVFGAASAWAAYSGSVGMLIAARAGMGVGAAMMMPATLSIAAGAALVFAALPARPRADAPDQAGTRRRE
ncbi:MFS transporter [Streptomyces sp. NPDC006668]|uniref:MFS transporter n=1 Tax=Streptomyces sp. NPDC006668 TaxID=3156903 RepID=UPI0033C6B994